METACISCRFFIAFREPEGERTPGLCRRYPPKLYSGGLTAWPDTDTHQWCGEFVARRQDEPLAIFETAK